MNTMRLLEAMTNIDSTIIEKAQIQPKRSSRSVGRILLVAALIAMLAITAFAAGEAVNWFKDYFTGNANTELTPNQIIYIEENTTDLTQSQTCNGYTIAVESAFSDGTDGIIKLKLIAPEGVKLDAINYFPGNDGCLTPVGEETVSQWNGGWGCVREGTPENEVNIIFTLHNIIDGRTHWKLSIEDICGTYEENPGEANYRQWTELVAEGKWEFDIVFSDNGIQEIEMIQQPVEGEVNIALNKESYHKVMITSLKLRALSAEITYEFLEPTHASGEFDAIFVVMKDGSQIMMLPKSGYTGFCTYHFAVPIILTDVDYVLLPGGIKLPVPQ